MEFAIFETGAFGSRRWEQFLQLGQARLFGSWPTSLLRSNK